MDGLLLINKPVGISSFDVIRKLKRVFKKIKIGHTGTLDPIADGVLVVMLGQTNKLRFFFENDKKLYLAKMRLGYKSDTFDSEGVLSKVDSTIPNENVVKECLKARNGNYNQTPPEYSAVKVNGKPAYYWKREKNLDLKLKSKEVGVHTRFVSLKDDYVCFFAKVTKGTYIRTLIDDLGTDLGCGAYMASLTRVKNGNFKIFDTFSVEKEGEQIVDKVMKNEDFFIGYEHYVLPNKYIEHVANGILLDSNLLSYYGGKKVVSNYLPVFSDGKLICFIKRIDDNKRIEYKRVLIANN